MAAAQNSPPDWKKVAQHIEEGLACCEKLGARPDLALTHFHYAELLQKKGDHDAAREQLDQATALFRDMEMAWWLKQAEKLGGELAGA